MLAQSEYIAACDARRAYISGFTGSAGFAFVRGIAVLSEVRLVAGSAVVTMKEAGLFTDGRYFLQAEMQLDKNWTLVKGGMLVATGNQATVCILVLHRASRLTHARIMVDRQAGCAVKHWHRPSSNNPHRLQGYQGWAGRGMLRILPC